MKYLNLDSTFHPYGVSNEIFFVAFTFSGGEPHLKIQPFDTNEKVTITQRFNSFNDLGMVCMAVDALQRMGVKSISLFVPYFPGARQDRIMTAGEPLSVKVYADIFNAMQLEKITVFDPHSEVTPALLNHCEVLTNHVFVKKVIQQLDNQPILISPDGGALKKIYQVAKFLGGVDVVEGSKSRDVKTGKLSEFKVYDDDLGGKSCLIVDDICDGGGTFIGLAKELKNKNAGKLYLAVSHGIFSKGFDELTTYFEQIFTTDSIQNIENQSVVQITLQEILKNNP